MTPANPGPTVLVVDDEPAIISLLSAALPLFGFRVLTAPSAAEALAVFGQRLGQIDVILSDFNMPGADGLGFLRAMRALPSAVPFVVMSGALPELSEGLLHEAGVDLIVAKPLDLPRLAQSLHALAGG